MKKVGVMVVLAIVLGLAGCSAKDVPVVNEAEHTEAVNDGQQTEKEASIETPTAIPVLTEGQVVDGVYHNDYFDLEMMLPRGWTVLTPEEMDQVMNTGKQSLEAANESLAEDLGEAHVVALLGLFKYPLDRQQPFNPSLLISVEKLEPLAGIAEGKAYLEASKEILMSAGIPYTFDDEVTVISIRGKIFGTMNATIDSGETTIVQTYYAAVAKGYAINIVTTYMTDEDAGLLRKVLSLPTTGQ